MTIGWPWRKKNERAAASRVFVEHEVALGHLSRHDRSLEEAASVEPGLFDSSARPLGLSISAGRFRGILFALLISLLFLSARAAQLQIVNGDYYRAQAEENRFQIKYLPAERGIITDRYGEILGENFSAFTLMMTIENLPDEAGERDRVFARAADLTGLQRADFDLLLQEYAEVPNEEIIVEKNLDYEHALLAMIEAPDLPGFSVRSDTSRRYNSAALSLSHVLGYVGKIDADEFAEKKDEDYRRTDEIGKTGVELSWETALRGRPGRRLVEVDAAGNETIVYFEEPPLKGSTLILEIDAALQKAAEQYLINELAVLDKKRGSVVVIDPNNGGILALISLPSYDDNLFSGGIDKNSYTALAENANQPLFPRAVSGEFPSGSTFKPYVAAAALAEGLIIPTTSFLSTGGLTIGSWFFPDWKVGGHGETNVGKAIAESVNTFFYIIGGGFDAFTGLGVERITSYARLFGFGSLTGLDLPNEGEGFLPSKEWKEEVKGERWYVGDTYHLAIGQGDLLVTPLQMAVALSTVANGGTKYEPHVAKAVGDQWILPKGTVLPEELRQAIKIVREGMRQTVTSGSARRLNSLPLAAAGKTGTAQIGGSSETHAWFTGFAPYENPEIAVVVLIEEGGEGSSTAVPVAENIFRWWYQNRD